MNTPEQILVAIEQHPLPVIGIGLFILGCLVITRSKSYFVTKQIVRGGVWRADSKDTE